MSTKEFSFSSSHHTLSTCLVIQTSADYQLVCGDLVSYQSLVSWIKKQSRLVKLNNVLLSSGSTTADLHFQATHSHCQGIVNCIFCVEIFTDLSRSQGTKNEILQPSPTLDVQSASVHATNSKFPEESTIQHQTMFTPQDTASAPPQMPLDNPKFTAYASSLLEKASQNGLNAHILEKSLKVVTHQETPYGSPRIQWDPLH